MSWCEIGTVTNMAMSVQLSEEAERVLVVLTREDGVSKDEAINRAILDLGTRMSRERDVRTLARDAILNYGPLLERLAQ
jgi:hypothetical protein